jgi:hypothetical protein
MKKVVGWADNIFGVLLSVKLLFIAGGAWEAAETASPPAGRIVHLLGVRYVEDSV